MKLRPAELAALCILAVLGSTPESASAQCEPDGDVRFLCGPPSPEDLLEVRGTPWIMVSSRTSDDDGYLIAADRRDLSTVTLYPSAAAGTAHDTDLYASCPGAPSGTFQPHGIALREESGGRHTFYVVGHGPREAVEVFRLDVTRPTPSLTWIGCVVAPEGVSLNSVTPVPGGGIVVTNFRVAGGELWEWTPGDGWSEVPGTEMSGPNGVVASADGRWLYIGGWGEEALVRVSRGSDPVQRDEVGVGFHIDNVRWTPDGALLAAGQYGASVASIGACLGGGSCEGVSSRVARIDPDALTAEELVDYPSNELLPFGTVAIELADEIWLGGIAGGTRIARFSR